MKEALLPTSEFGVFANSRRDVTEWLRPVIVFRTGVVRMVTPRAGTTPHPPPLNEGPGAIPYALRGEVTSTVRRLQLTGCVGSIWGRKVC